MAERKYLRSDRCTFIMEKNAVRTGINCIIIKIDTVVMGLKLIQYFNNPACHSFGFRPHKEDEKRSTVCISSQHDQMCLERHHHCAQDWIHGSTNTMSFIICQSVNGQFMPYIVRIWVNTITLRGWLPAMLFLFLPQKFRKSNFTSI